MAEMHAACRALPEDRLCDRCADLAARGEIVQRPEQGWVSVDLTEPQQAVLRRAVSSRPFPGLIDFADAGVGIGLRRSAWTKMMARLRDQGIVEPYVHGGFEVTAAGRDLMRRRGLGEISG